jgi:hypothetical protein
MRSRRTDTSPDRRIWPCFATCERRTAFGASGLGWSCLAACALESFAGCEVGAVEHPGHDVGIEADALTAPLPRRTPSRICFVNGLRWTGVVVLNEVTNRTLGLTRSAQDAGEADCQSSAVREAPTSCRSGRKPGRCCRTACISPS